MVSDEALAAEQARVLASSPATVVLVEGLSDSYAVQAVADRLGRPLETRGVAILPMGGVTNIGRFLALLGPGGRGLRLAGLCDAGEEAWLRSRLERAGVGGDGFFVCHRDLEDELIRSLGVERVEAIIAGQGDTASLHKLQQMVFHRGRSVDAQLHRFMGVRSGRKQRYARLLAEAVDPERVPAPLAALLAYV